MPQSTHHKGNGSTNAHRKTFGHLNSWPLLHADNGRAGGRLSDGAGNNRRTAHGRRSAGRSCAHVGRQAGRSSRQTIRCGKSDRRRDGDRRGVGREGSRRWLHTHVHTEWHACNQRHALQNLPYNPAADFVPIALLAKVPFVLVVDAALPVRSIPDLIKYAKERPGTISFSSTGTGAVPHLAAEMLKGAIGIEMTCSLQRRPSGID